MTQFIGFLLIALNIYVPVQVWIDHSAGVATPLWYIALGGSIAFWIYLVNQLATPKTDRKIYSANDMARVMMVLGVGSLEDIHSKAAKTAAKTEDETMH